MNAIKPSRIVTSLVLVLAGLWGTANAAPYIQCPGDLDPNNPLDEPDAVPHPDNPNYDPNVKCMHLSGGDGFIRMADGREMYMFSFADITGVKESQSIDAGILAANFPAPTIVLDEGEELYLTLTNVGMMMRPDLADPHTVHFHGFPNASDVFDGVPEATISINMGASLTYYYNIVEPGTYMYHCHVEATEHMQMGMLGNLYVHPAQDGQSYEYPQGSGRVYTKFAYNDGDGSTGYDVEVPVQIGSFDPVFHDASQNVQPLPFADMKDTYPMLNGRGYPDTASATPPAAPTQNGGQVSQPVSTLVEANQGQRILLRISNLNVTNFYTLTALGLPMQVVGTGARQLRGPAPAPGLKGKDVMYGTSSVTLGGGEAKDVIIDTAGVPPGTYFLYSTNLNFLSNNDEDFGGMMTEIQIN